MECAEKSEIKKHRRYRIQAFTSMSAQKFCEFGTDMRLKYQYGLIKREMCCVKKNSIGVTFCELGSSFVFHIGARFASIFFAQILYGSEGGELG